MAGSLSGLGGDASASQKRYEAYPPTPQGNRTDLHINRTLKKIGIFGGTFDPVHKGHVELLKAAQKYFGFDFVYVVPTAQNPLKDRNASPLLRRLMLLRKAIRLLRFARVSLVEAGGDRPRYTVDTLKYFRLRHPSAKLFFICGSDCLENFDKWKSPDKILRLATLAVARRAGYKQPAARAGFVVFPMKPIRRSSTEIRSH